ncbi:hypothetical protein PQO01_20060 [Lentisphaera marina]|uniref:hypothetical protein n=1 Tax=Lentisphaera marina TaxID=1111041 RepID=UPI00236565C3|nr:hypothetical protein [Lentisphaera marina]MDD7987254.1 hypothetical protein [Lentisphaera marina]
MHQNWMTPGQNRDGLMRINLYKSKPFEMLAIPAKSNGIEIEFIKAIKEEDAWNKSLYQVKQWTYKPTHYLVDQKLIRSL